MIAKTFEFGETDESKAFLDHNPTFVDGFEAILNVANKYFGREVQPQTPLEDLAFSLGHTCRNDLAEIVFLAVNGYSNGALKLFRGLYERVATLAYLVEKPEKASRFIRFAAVQDHRAMQGALKTFTEAEIDEVIGPKSVREIRENYEQVKGEFQITVCAKCKTKRIQPSWDLDFASIVHQLGDLYQQFYLGAYVVPTLQAHATLASAFDGHITEEDESAPKKVREQGVVLYGAIRIFILLLRLQERVFSSLALAGEIDACEKAMVPCLTDLMLRS